MSMHPASGESPINPTDMKPDKFWLGRIVLGSEQLTEKLLDICDYGQVFTHNDTHLAYSMMPSKTLRGETEVDAHWRMSDFMTTFPQIDMVTPIRLDPHEGVVISPKGQVRNRIIIPFAANTESAELERESLAMKHYFVIRKRPFLSFLRVVDSIDPALAPRAAAAIQYSGLLDQLTLGPLQVCSSK